LSLLYLLLNRHLFQKLKLKVNCAFNHLIIFQILAKYRGEHGILKPDQPNLKPINIDQFPTFGGSLLVPRFKNLRLSILMLEGGIGDPTKTTQRIPTM
jgi:hypothetical protein